MDSNNDNACTEGVSGREQLENTPTTKSSENPEEDKPDLTPNRTVAEPKSTNRAKPKNDRKSDIQPKNKKKSVVQPKNDKESVPNSEKKSTVQPNNDKKLGSKGKPKTKVKNDNNLITNYFPRKKSAKSSSSKNSGSCSQDTSKVSPPSLEALV